MFRCKLKRCQSDTPLQVQIIFSRVRTLGLGMRGTRARDCGLMSRCRCYVSTMRQVFIYLSMHCLTLATSSKVDSEGFQALHHIQNNYTQYITLLNF